MFSTGLRGHHKEGTVRKSIYLGDNKLLTIETPLEAPQPPLDSGWWRFQVKTLRVKPEHIFELRIKNAGTRFEFLASWLSDITGHTVGRDNNPAIVRELVTAAKSLPRVQLT